MHIWENVTKPFFDCARINYELIVTQRQNHARDLMADDERDWSHLECIVIISGDGLIFEIVNGLASRKNGSGLELLKRLPICPIPGS